MLMLSRASRSLVGLRCSPFLCSKALGPSLPAWRQRCASHVTHAKDNDDDDEEADPGKPLRVERLLANLGYGKRKECQQLVQRGRAVRRDGTRLKVGEKVVSKDILLDGEELDPAFPMVLVLNKPVGYVVTAPDDERILDPKVYDLLPYRFSLRRPFVSAIGRLDKATSGLLIMTDDGQLVHRVKSPKKGIWKVYEATLDAPLQGKDAEAAIRRFASGALTLVGEDHPLLPAKLEMLSDVVARVSICEGRYHQVRRMFTAVGREVVALQRLSIGGLSIADLPSGEWKYLTPCEVDLVFTGPTAEEMMGSSSGPNTSDPAEAATGGMSTTATSGGRKGTTDAGEDGDREDADTVAGVPKLMREKEKRRKLKQALKKMVNNM